MMVGLSEYFKNIIAAEKSGLKTKGVLMSNCTVTNTPSPVEMAEVKEENKRLREALEDVTKVFHGSTTGKLWSMYDIANKALKENE